MRLREAINDIKKGVIHPVYLLKGDDHFLQNFFINKLEKELFVDQPTNRMRMLPDEIKGKEKPQINIFITTPAPYKTSTGVLIVIKNLPKNKNMLYNLREYSV